MPPVGKKLAALLYPKYEVKIYCLPKDGFTYDGPLTVALAKKLLRWESEEEYTKRMVTANPNTKETKWKYGDKFLFRDATGLTAATGAKINCWNNCRNRPFDLKRAQMYAQDVLNRTFMMNCENIIISCTGLVISGQHRLIGLILAAQEWMKCKVKGGKGKWEEQWEQEPFIETMVAYGCSDDPKVIRTLDNVKPRTLSDTIYTSPLFANLSVTERLECSRMLGKCIPCLFKRTKQLDSWNRFETNSFAHDFADAHPRIEQCVDFIFKNNRDRVVSNLDLSAGQSAAMLYLMGASATQEEDYHFSKRKTEKLIDWANWDKAMEFWSGLVDPKNNAFGGLREVLQNLKDPNTGGKCREVVKQMVLSLAWNAWIEGGVIAKADLDIKPFTLWSAKKDRTIITEEPTVGGIDQGIIKGGGEEADKSVTPDEKEELDENIEEAAKERTAQLDAVAKQAKAEATRAPVKPGQSPFTPEERAALVRQVTQRASNGHAAPPAPANKPTAVRPGKK